MQHLAYISCVHSMHRTCAKSISVHSRKRRGESTAIMSERHRHSIMNTRCTPRICYNNVGNYWKFKEGTNLKFPFRIKETIRPPVRITISSLLVFSPEGLETWNAHPLQSLAPWIHGYFLKTTWIWLCLGDQHQSWVLLSSRRISFLLKQNMHWAGIGSYYFMFESPWCTSRVTFEVSVGMCAGYLVPWITENFRRISID